MNLKKGIVYFVGAGPGDRGLITVKGAQVLAQADVVLYDHLINHMLLNSCSAHAEKICVGKRGGEPSMTQEEINGILVEKARAGNIVVRLKGGDPFLFGRGAEEAQFVSRAGIPFQVIPGVPSAIAVPAYAGIPVTDRRYASSVAMITGHEAFTKERSAIAWQEIAHAADTLVFLMGMRTLSFIVQQLIVHGREPDTPAAVIQRGTTGTQKVVAGTLESICELVQLYGLQPPGLLIVGDVVRLRHDLKWYEHMPLFGKRFIITRELQERDTLADFLENSGAEVVPMPTIAITRPDSYQDADDAIAQLEQFSWIVFTSSNGVRYFMERLINAGKDIRSLSGRLIAAIGSGTARTLNSYYLQADLVPDEFSAEGVVQTFARRNISGVKILIPRAQKARDVLESGLIELNNDVRAVPVYKTIAPQELRHAETFKSIYPGDCVVFTSSSTVHNFFDFAPPAVLSELCHMVLACIGPVTETALRKHGYSAHIIPESYDFDSLAQAIIRYYVTQRQATNHNS
jgi:uroporphyrinogen III methyltransferase/synthase